MRTTHLSFSHTRTRRATPPRSMKRTNNKLHAFYDAALSKQ